jgi:hypothetical protein
MNTQKIGAAVLGAAALAGSTAAPSPIPSTTATTTYHCVQVDGVGVFYREAGPKDAPTIVLLHGFAIAHLRRLPRHTVLFRIFPRRKSPQACSAT